MGSLRRAAWLRDHLPGVLLAVVGAVAAFLVNGRWGTLSPLTIALVFGLILGNSGFTPVMCEAGLRFATRHFLRWGIILLGLQLSGSEMFRLGGWGLLAVVGVVAVTFLGTQQLARWMGVGPGVGLLTATGYSICGVSAVTAMSGAVDGDDQDAAYAIALVTIFGGISIVALPALGHLLDVQAARFGMWAGSSVHDVAQVVATASTYSATSLAPAVVVKLTRVVLLAPLVAVMALRRRRVEPGNSSNRPPILPRFVAMFLVMVAVRSMNVLPDVILGSSKNIERFLLASALVGLGAGVRINDLRKLGSRPFLLGLTSWILVMTVSAAAVALIPPYIG